MRGWKMVGILCVVACGSPEGRESASESSSVTPTAATTAGPTGDETENTSTSTETMAAGTDSETSSSGDTGETETPTDEPTDTGEAGTDSETTDTEMTTETGATETGETDSGETEMTSDSSDTGELVCDGAVLWDDPFVDGSLRLAGTEHYGFDAGPHEHSWICVEELARINVCENTIIELVDNVDTVIGGDGIGPLADEPVSITLETNHSINVHMLVDVTGPPVDVWIDAPNACVTVTSKGQSELGFGGTSSAVRVSTEGGLVLNGYTGTGATLCPFEAEFSGGGGVIPAPACPL